MNYLVEPEETSKYGKELFDLIANNSLKLRIQEYPFTAQGAQDAQTALVGGKTIGKLVIKVADA
jgi:NADPH2:quinone reductase